MATYTWIGGTSTNWSDGSNWSSSPSLPIAPQSADDVIFTNVAPGLNNPCTITTLSTCRTLTINSGYTSLITLNADLQVGALNGSPANTGITINGTPTFTGSGWLNLLTAGTSGVARSISSSAATEIYKLRIGATTAVGANFNFSGSIIANNLFISNASSTNKIGFAPSTQFILRNKTSETAIVTGSGGFGFSTTSPVPTLVVSGSVSWETDMVVGYNMVIASGSTFRLTGSLGPNYQTLGGGLFFNRSQNDSLSTPLSFDVNADATILCTTASILSFFGGSSGGGLWKFNMSGSTTNIWNALRIGGGGSGYSLEISSDVYLAKNDYLPNLNIPADNIHRIKGALIPASTTNISTVGGSKTIYVGGSIVPFFQTTLGGSNILNSLIKYAAGGPRIVMYGTGYISPPPLNILLSNTLRSTIGLGIDLNISSSDGTIRWGCGSSLNNRLITNGNSLGLTFPTWSYVTAANYDALLSTTYVIASPGVLMNFQNKPIWDLELRNNLETRLTSSLTLSGSLYTLADLNNLTTSSLTSPSLTVLQNVQSLYTTGSGNAPTLLGSLRGNAPITMSGNLPATYSLLVPINNGRGNDILINKPGGNLLITNPLNGSGIIPNETRTPIPLTYDSGTFKWTAGTINTSNSTLRLGNSASMDTTNNLSWYNITVSGSGTGTARGSLVNIISPLVISNELNLGAAGNVAFTGSDTWTCSRLVCTTPGRRIILQDAVSNGQKEYRTTNFVNLSSSVASPIFMSSSNTPTTRASWSVSFNAPDANVFNVSGAYIDSSNGRTIFTTGGTSNTINWNLGTQPISSFYTFFIS